MYKRATFSILAAFTLLTSCKTPNIAVSEDLKSNTTIMDAKGRHGWQYNQVIRFGDYSTSKIKRGWTKSYNIEFVARFQGAEQKLSFLQRTPDALEAEVLAVGKFKSNEIDLLRGFLAYSFEYENYYAGSIIMAHNKNHIWDFVIHNPEGSSPKYAECGIAKDQFGNEITIRGVKKIEGQRNWAQFENYGFEFSYNGQPIGAVSTLNKGRVWLKNDIHPDLKLVVSSLATSLLVRHSLEEGVRVHS